MSLPQLLSGWDTVNVDSIRSPSPSISLESATSLSLSISFIDSASASPSIAGDENSRNDLSEVLASPGRIKMHKRYFFTDGDVSLQAGRVSILSENENLLAYLRLRMFCTMSIVVSWRLTRHFLSYTTRRRIGSFYIILRKGI